MKNNLLYFFIASLCFVGFSSCSDDEDTSIQFYSSSEKVNTISVTTIGEAFVEVRNVKGTFTVKSNDEALATASINEHLVIHIKGIKEGTTSVTVTDSENRTATLNVDVITYTQSISILKQEVLVETEVKDLTSEEQVVVDKIKAEILDKLPPVGGGYKLIYTSDLTGNLIYYPDTKDLAEKIEGTFKWNENEVSGRRILKLYYNDKESIYTFDATGSVAKVRSSEIPNVYMIIDFTDDYTQITAPKITKAVGGLLINFVQSF